MIVCFKLLLPIHMHNCAIVHNSHNHNRNHNHKQFLFFTIYFLGQKVDVLRPLWQISSFRLLRGQIFDNINFTVKFIIELRLKLQWNYQILFLRWLDWIFQGVYFPTLRVYYVGINKVIGKRLQQPYYIKIAICYDLYWLRSCHDNVTTSFHSHFLHLCFSVPGAFFRNHLTELVPSLDSIMAKFEQILWQCFGNILKKF